jgi:hypothetical protein
MLITECPWCDGPAVVADTLDCEGCGVAVEIATDDEALARAA